MIIKLLKTTDFFAAVIAYSKTLIANDMKKIFGLFLSLIVLMGFWSCNQKEFDNLQLQIDELKIVQIASINAQIAGIKSSIESMEKMDEHMKSRIDELTKKQQELESTDAEQAKEIAALKESLIEEEASLLKRIDELKSYVEEELKTQKDWVSATFSTLEQYQSTCDEIAALKLALSAQETTLRELVSTTESSIKTWVNEQLSGYYTIAEMDAKISQLSKSIADGDAAQAAALEKLRAELNVARTDIKTAYEKAVEDAITTSEGKINEKIANDIRSATDALQGQINELNTKIADIEKRLGLVEASLEKILSQVQSIVVVPTYSDGTVRIKKAVNTEIRFEVSPRSASIALAKQGPEVFSLDAVSTQTKASMFVANFPIKSVFDNGECLVVKLDAAKMDMESVYANPSMSARLKIDDGNSSMTTGYFNLYVDSSNSLYPWAELPVMCDVDLDGVHDNEPNLYYATHFTDLKSPTGGAARNYTVCFSGEHHCPVWVAAPRHQMYQVKGVQITYAYKKDPKIPADIQYNSKSAGGGCNKGHMLGPTERFASRTTNEQVFYYSNIAPQLSKGFSLSTFEVFVDGQVCSDTLYVVTGCYFDEFTDGYGESASPKTITFGGRNDVDMPTMFYYALLRTKNGDSGKDVRNCSASEIQCAAFVRAHTNSLKGQRVSSKEMMSISDLEKITGVRYFENVPNAPKTSFDASEWGL